MKLKISMGLNIVFAVLILVLGGGMASTVVGNHYYRKAVGLVASGAVVALENGNTKLVYDALSGIRSDPDARALNEAGKKLGVISY